MKYDSLETIVKNEVLLLVFLFAELENAVKISKKSLKKSILLVRKDVSVMKGEIFDTVKEEINKGKCSNNEDDGTSGPQRTEAVKNLVDKMLRYENFYC